MTCVFSWIFFFSTRFTAAQVLKSDFLLTGKWFPYVLVQIAESGCDSKNLAYDQCRSGGSSSINRAWVWVGQLWQILDGWIRRQFICKSVVYINPFVFVLDLFSLSGNKSPLISHTHPFFSLSLSLHQY